MWYSLEARTIKELKQMFFTKIKDMDISATIYNSEGYPIYSKHSGKKTFQKVSTDHLHLISY